MHHETVLFQDSAVDTIAACRAALAYLAEAEQVAAETTANELTPEARSGRYILMLMVCDALRHAEDRLTARPHLVPVA